MSEIPTATFVHVVLELQLPYIQFYYRKTAASLIITT